MENKSLRHYYPNTMPNSTPRILIVEDSATQAERLKFILERNDYLFETARNGVEALALIETNPPSLVISDIVMPEMDGYELCRRLKKDERLKRIPVILLTSLTDPVDVVKGLESGADNFIFKPYNERYLISRVAYVLANQRQSEPDMASMGVEVFFSGRKFFITSDRLQILNLLLSTYETAVERNRELANARDDLRHLNDTLEGKVAERTAALEIEIAERRRAEAEVRRLNSELEQRVQQRTLQLETMNQELEAFSYSVSHDLRTPLRHIAGFAGMLEKRCGSQLNEQGRGYLETINDAVAKMGRLIEDLLEFSRMGRTDLQHAAVDLTTVIDELRRDLEIDAGERKINWQIESMPLVRADPAMMRQVFANLLGNAVKYTRTRERAEITVGAKSTATEMVFFVRDNGVGFDMKYAANLFGVFQRLHRADEFEGTGIGLANVRRIIARHGGRTWAEAKADEGATFYVTLPAPPNGHLAQRGPE